MIEPLSQARLAEVIAPPARRAGLEFAPGLIERMVQDTAGGDALPLLAHTLRELGEQAGPDGRIGIADYDAVGGVVGALRNRADRVAEELGRRGHGELVVPTLVQLATVTGQDEPTRRRVLRSTLTSDEQAVVDAFVDARLLTSDHAPAAATGAASGDATVEVAHEALLRQWPPLREAIEADRNGLRLRSELERLAADWERANRDDAYLLRGARLAVFEEWASTHPGALETAQSRDTERARDVGALQAEFVRRSRARQRREVRRWRVVAAVLAVLALTAGTLTFVAVRNAAQITAQLATANAEAIARESGARLGRDPLLAAELAVLAWRSDPASARARSALADAYVALAGTDSVIYTHPGRRRVGQIFTDGELLKALSPPSDFSLTTGVLGPAPVPVNLPRGVNLGNASPNGSQLALIAENGRLRLHDIDGSDPSIELTEPGADVRAARFSPDGNLLTWISGESLRVHEIRSRTTTTTPFAFPPGTEAVQLTTDPDLALVRTDRGIAVHSLTTSAEIRALSADTIVTEDGRYTVTCMSDDPTYTTEPDELVVRDAASDTELRRIPLRTVCSSVRYTPNSRHALERLSLPGDTDSPADTRTGRQLGSPVPVPAMRDPRLMWVRTGHPGEVITAGNDVLELWNVPSGRRLGSDNLTVRHYRGVVTRGDTLVMLTPEGDIEVRTLPGMERVGDPIAAPELQALLGFDADGRLVAATDVYNAGHIVFWDLERRAESGRMRANGGAPYSVDGGPVIVSGSDDLLPEALDVRAEVWHGHLCRLLPRELSDAAIGLLPAGTDRSSPCP